MNFRRAIIACFFVLFLFSFASWGKNFVVVIDPGHGGKDSGAPGASSKEKDINLKVALKFGELLEKNHQDVRVLYTRKTDRFVDLNERANMANRFKADLFVSIHTNAVNKNAVVFGAETYTLGLARTEENLAVAKRENSVIKLEDNYEQKYENFDPNSTESYIIFEFIQNKYVEQSVHFASLIQKEFVSSAKRSDRGVRQAGLLVLRKTSMPSVLVELGFISNPSEERYMKSDSGQKALAESLYKAFHSYKWEHDRKSGVLTAEALAPSKAATETTVEQHTDTPAPVKTQITPSKASVPNSQKPATVKPGGLVYKVQVLISSTKLPAASPKFKGYKVTDFYMDGGIYKYTYGESADLNEMNKLRVKLSNDFKDAFVVTFKDGVRVK